MTQYRKEILFMSEKVMKNFLVNNHLGILLNNKYKLDLFEVYLLWKYDDKMDSLACMIEELEIDKRILMPIINKLCKSSLMKKSINEQDKRTFSYSLTDEGVKYKELVDVEFNKVFEFLLKDLTVNDEKGILKYISKLNQATKQ